MIGSASIKIHALTDFDPLDGLTQVRMGSFDQEEIMRDYQAKGMHLDPVSFHRLADIFQELFPVPLAPM